MRTLLTVILTLGGLSFLQAHDYVEVVHVKHRHGCCSHRKHHHSHCHSHCCHKHRYSKRIYYTYDMPCEHMCCGPRHRVHVQPSFGFGFFIHP